MSRSLPGALGAAPEPPKLVCAGPYMVHGRMPVPCGQCRACRIAAKRRVVLRAQLERGQHEHACCATLTYSDEFVGDYQVRPADWVHARDRLRYQVQKDLGVKLRFYGVGEYGELKGRPHWHVVAFGLPLHVGQEYWQQAWTDPSSGQLMGDVKVGEADHAAFAYLAGYCVKKMTRPDDPWLAGRAPEFVIRPNRPGLGLGVAQEVAQAIVSDEHGLAAVKRAGDVPTQMRLGRGLQAIDKVFLNKVRDAVLGEAGAELAREARKANYLGECAAGAAAYGRGWALGGPASHTVRVLQRLTRAEIFASRKVL